MKLTIEAAALSSALSRIAPIIIRRTPIPILECAKLTATDALEITGSDMTVEIRESVPAEISGAGSICVPAVKIAALAGSIKRGGKIEIDAKDGEAIFRYSGGRTRFVTLPDTDYPIMKSTEAAVALNLPGNELARLLSMAIPFAETDATLKSYLSGVRLEIVSERMNAIATDGKILAVGGTPIAGAEDFAGVTVPRESCLALIRALKAGGDATLSLSPSAIEIGCGALHIKSRVIDADFPDYRRAVPAAQPNCVTVDAEALREVAARVQAVTETTGTSSSHPRVMEITVKDGALLVAGGSQADQRVEEELDARCDGVEATVGLKTKNVLDALDALDGEAVSIHFASERFAVLFHREGDPSETVTIGCYRV